MASYSLKTNTERVHLKTRRTFHGVPLIDLDNPHDLSKVKFPFPINWCLCVHDSPDHPCPCTQLIVWITDKKVDATKTGMRNKKGQEIIAFTVPKDTELMIELCIPIKLKDLLRISKMGPYNKNQCKHEHGVAKNTPPPPPFGWVALAATAGYAIGGVLDDLFGSNDGGNDDLSDDISDWLAENLPAPGWLQDLF